jgi:hypothetical protein
MDYSGTLEVSTAGALRWPLELPCALAQEGTLHSEGKALEGWGDGDIYLF